MTKEGRPRLKSTQRALDELVIAWLGMGLTILEIASNLKVSNKAVEYRWARMKQAYGFRCYQDATRYAIKTKLIPCRIHFDL